MLVSPELIASPGVIDPGDDVEMNFRVRNFVACQCHNECLLSPISVDVVRLMIPLL